MKTAKELTVREDSSLSALREDANSLAAYYRVHRRYYRSVNLERDLEQAELVQGYIPTERSAEALRRILTSLNNPKAHRAWTMTGVYGTGKSAFAHYLLSLLAPIHSETHQAAMAIAHQAFGAESNEVQALQMVLPEKGLFRAVATGRREPLSWTIARALAHGADEFWRGRHRPEVFRTLTDWEIEATTKDLTITDQEVLLTLKELVEAANTPLFFVIDELGKNLEYAVHHQGTADLYLLQQLAELKLKGAHQVYFLGIFHQSFAGYGDRLAAVEQSEWMKIQGRFSEIFFTESPGQMTRLIGQAIDRTKADPVLSRVRKQAEAWFVALSEVLKEQEISVKVLSEVYPIHPITALVLPLLCTRYAQNDRSLFTFLTSDEPHALNQFLTQNAINAETIPSLKLHQVYDYFVESVTGLSSRINLQRWVEIQGLIQDAGTQEPEVLQVLKTIGILNLITTTGKLRATPTIVALSLSNSPDKNEISHWHELIKQLQNKGLINFRTQTEELRIWEGSDFNVEAALHTLLEQSRTPLVQLLSSSRPLKPLVAQRHYSITGNLRYFEQCYVDSSIGVDKLHCSGDSYDGLIAYWVDTQPPKQIPASTTDDKPLILIMSTALDLLRIRSQEFHTLQTIYRTAPELTNDGVARREVKQRLVEAERLLDETLRQSFNWTVTNNKTWVQGQLTEIKSSRAFQAVLSQVCDRVYHLGINLDSELINRRDLTNQGAKARRQLIEAILGKPYLERLGLEGYGPEVAMYYSVLGATGVHRQVSGGFGFYPPDQSSGVFSLWQAIERFFWSAQDNIQTLDLLYRHLEAPPYGVKRAIIPVMIASALMCHVDDISVYKDGTFIPILSADHFELLVKDPGRYGVKYIEVAGLRAQVFRELEAVLRSSTPTVDRGVRNVTLLAVVKPLFQFVRRLTPYTTKTKSLSPTSAAVLHALSTAQEPDNLLFVALPTACGLPPISGESDDGSTARALVQKLVQSLQEIQQAYDLLLENCKTLLHHGFEVPTGVEKLRENLRVRSEFLVSNCIDPLLRRFTLAAVEDSTSDREWLEALVMIVGDKPAESWSDEDVTAFELKLSDLVRRFKNLEALGTELRAKSHSGFEARRITITHPNGQEIHRVVWIDSGQKDSIECIVEEILSKPSLINDNQLQQAIVSRLAEKVFSSESPEAVTFQKQYSHVQEGSKTHSRTIRRQG